MHIVFRKSFEKDFAKCTTKIQMHAEERVQLFISDRFSPLLNFHTLRGEYHDCYSINVSADVRIIFYLKDNTMHLIRLGTHSQLYG